MIKIQDIFTFKPKKDLNQPVILFKKVVA